MSSGEKKRKGKKIKQTQFFHLYLHTHTPRKTTFMCPMSILGVPSGQALLCYPAHHSYAFSTAWGINKVAASQTNKQTISSSPNVIPTRQTCGQRSSRAAGSKCQALEHDFPEQVCYMFLILKCGRDWELLVSSIFRYYEYRANSVVKKDSSAQRLLPAAMLERWPQVCRVKITLTLLLTNCFVSTTTNSMKCLGNWMLLRTEFGREIPNPTLNLTYSTTLDNHIPYTIYKFKLACGKYTCKTVVSWWTLQLFNAINFCFL